MAYQPLSRVFRLSSPEAEQDRQLLFLSRLAHHGIISRAMLESRVKRSELRDWQLDPEFADLYRFAIDCAADYIESEAWDRAVTGVEEPVFGAHGKIGTRRVKSEGLLRELLKARKPGHFRDRPSAAPLPDQAARRAEYEAQLERLRLRREQAQPSSPAPSPATPAPTYAAGQGASHPGGQPKAGQASAASSTDAATTDDATEADEGEDAGDQGQGG